MPEKIINHCVLGCNATYTAHHLANSKLVLLGALYTPPHIPAGFWVEQQIPTGISGPQCEFF